MISIRFLRNLSTATLAFGAVTAHACTVCNSRTGHQVRAGLFNGHFLQTCLLVLAPFPLLAAVVGLLHWAMSRVESTEDRFSKQAGFGSILPSCPTLTQPEAELPA